MSTYAGGAVLSFFFGSRSEDGDRGIPRLRLHQDAEDQPAGIGATQTGEDRALLDRIRAGDQLAFSQCYEKNFRALWTFAYGYLKTGSAAEDIVQDVFASLWERRDKLDIRSSVTVYLYSAVKQRALANL